MSRQRVAILGAAALLAAALYLLPLARRGLVGPDEPRYASIAREMAESGDWTTPSLWGADWFEKPALLFWMGGAGHALGLGEPTRVPVALLCLGFLAFFYRRVQRSFDADTALAATAVLATSAGWVAYADAGVFDAPLTVFASAALLCLLPWAQSPGAATRRDMAAFGALLGLGVLSKGLVAPIIAALAAVPVLAARPRAALDVAGPVPLGAFAVVCLPWYAACYAANGRVFLDDFIVKHHFERFFSDSLQHVQPWWFYAPVIAAFLLPWTPLLGSLRWDTLAGGPRRRFLTCWALLPVVLLSASVNKLPAYILPALPPLAILLAIRWRARPSRPLLACGAATLLLVPLAGSLLPAALADGIRRAWAGLDPASIAGGVSLGLIGSALACAAALRLSGARAVAGVGVVAALALATLKFQAYPAISAQAGVREFMARETRGMRDACIGDVRRHAAYGIRYYSRNSVPDCAAADTALRIEADPPRLVPNVPASEGRR